MIEKFKEFTTKEFNEYNKHKFIKINIDLLQNHSKVLCKNGGAFVAYNRLAANIARYKWDDTKIYPLKKEFYEKGYLVCTFSIRKFAEILDVSKSTTERYIKTMEELRWIDVAKIKGKNKFNDQNVYILGEWTNVVVDGEEKYLEDLYINYRM